MQKVKERRGITLMPMLYKIYAAIVAKRLENEIEEKKILLDSQAGFRERRGVMDNLYVLNFLKKKNKKEGEEGNSMDLRATFDIVDRRKLSDEMEKREISGRARTAEIYKET